MIGCPALPGTLNSPTNGGRSVPALIAEDGGWTSRHVVTRATAPRRVFGGWSGGGRDVRSRESLTCACLSGADRTRRLIGFIFRFRRPDQAIPPSNRQMETISFLRCSRSRGRSRRPCTEFGPPRNPVRDSKLEHTATRTIYRYLAVVALAGVTCSLPLPVFARFLDLDPPSGGKFVLDRAYMMESSDADEIQSLSEELLAEHQTSIFVVTITSMADHSYTRDVSIETFAQKLFDEWGIGHPRVGGESWNTGILLLVSEQDQKARIELGAGWEHQRDDLCRQIMDEQIIPRFKDGDFSFGILSGVRALDDMARGKPLPAKPWTRNKFLGVGLVSGLVLFTLVSVFRSGRNGWAWVLWATVFGALAWLLYQFFKPDDRRYRRSGYYDHDRGYSRSGSGFGSGGGFGGGGLGGGSSGGGGATGSW